MRKRSPKPSRSKAVKSAKPRGKSAPRGRGKAKPPPKPAKPVKTVRFRGKDGRFAKPPRWWKPPKPPKAKHPKPSRSKPSKAKPAKRKPRAARRRVRMPRGPAAKAPSPGLVSWVDQKFFQSREEFVEWMKGRPGAAGVAGWIPLSAPGGAQSPRSGNYVDASDYDPDFIPPELWDDLDMGGAEVDVVIEYEET